MERPQAGVGGFLASRRAWPTSMGYTQRVSFLPSRLLLSRIRLSQYLARSCSSYGRSSNLPPSRLGLRLSPSILTPLVRGMVLPSGYILALPGRFAARYGPTREARLAVSLQAVKPVVRAPLNIHPSYLRGN